MKRVLLLLSLPLFVCAGDDEAEEQRSNKIKKALGLGVAYSILTDIKLPNTKLTKDDFATLMQITICAETIDVSHNEIDGFTRTNRRMGVISLDVSDNKFVGSFPLSSALYLFPDLKTLKFNNHTNVTGVLFPPDMRNDTLETLEARNTGMALINLEPFFRYLSLRVLDLSESKGLGCIELPRSYARPGKNNYDSYILQVLLKNTKKDFSFLKQKVKINTPDAEKVIAASILVGGVAGRLIYIESPLGPLAGGIIGMLMGCAFANCLPNRGQRAIIEFVTK